MPASTARLQLPYPVLADSADVPRDIQALAAKLDPNTGWTLAGALAARPAAADVPERTVYYATDTHALSITLAGNWLDVVPPADAITGAMLKAGAVTTREILDGTIARGDLSFTGVLSSLQGYTKMAVGTVGVAAGASALVNHGLGVSAGIVSLTPFGVGLPAGGQTVFLNYDVPNGTQVRIYNHGNLGAQAAWIAFG